MHFKMFHLYHNASLALLLSLAMVFTHNMQYCPMRRAFLLDHMLKTQEASLGVSPTVTLLSISLNMDTEHQYKFIGFFFSTFRLLQVM